MKFTTFANLLFITIFIFSQINAAEPAKKLKRGLILVINAPCSSGKTSLCKKLLKKLNETEVKWVQQSLDEDAQEDEDDEDNEYSDADPNESMIKVIKHISDLGTNVLYDTILEQHYIAEFINKLKSGGYKVYPILIYCSPIELAQRLHNRNSNATTPELVREEARAPFQPFAQFGQLYRNISNELSSTRSAPATPSFQIPVKETLEAAKKLLQEEFPNIDQPKLKRHLSNDEVKRAIQGLKIDLDLVGDESVTITPRYSYALVIDNSNENKKEALLLLNNFIDEKVKEDQA